MEWIYLKIKGQMLAPQAPQPQAEAAPHRQASLGELSHTTSEIPYRWTGNFRLASFSADAL